MTPGFRPRQRQAGSPHPYARAAYVGSLTHIGASTEVPEWETPVLMRPIPGGGKDATGVYPLTMIAQDADLRAGLDRLRALGLVSVTVVPDPLSRPSDAALSTAFDVVAPLKSHLVLDPSVGPYDPSAHHRERIRRGHRRCRIEQGPLGPWLDDWTRLYAGLVSHRRITGVADFPAAHFETLAQEPGLRAFAAVVNEAIVGLTLWFAQDGVVYNHLTAVDATGYANGASFALYDAAITAFEGQGVMNLGGGAGREADGGGLFAFKQGFANGSVTALLCGAILDPRRYVGLGGEPSFFPAYRAPGPSGPTGENTVNAAFREVGASRVVFPRNQP